MATMKERFDAVEDQYLKWELVEHKGHSNRIIAAFLLVHLMMNVPMNFDVSANHDILYLPAIDELEDLDDEDIVNLARHGIHYSSEHDCLAMFC